MLECFVFLWGDSVQDAPIFGDDVDWMVDNAATRRGLGYHGLGCGARDPVPIGGVPVDFVAYVSH